MNPWILALAAVVTLTAAVNLAHTARRVVPPPRTPVIASKDPVVRHEARFAGVAAALQRHRVTGVVGYLADLPAAELPGSAPAMEEYFLTQFALAPWVLEASWRDSAWVVANLRQRSLAARRPADFDVVEDFGGGVFLLRRKAGS